MAAGVLLAATTTSAQVITLPDEPAPETRTEVPRYVVTADPGNPLGGITRVRPTLALSAPSAEACQVEAPALQRVIGETLQAAHLQLIATDGLDARAAAAVPELFTSVTVVRDETGLCAASIAVQLGVDTDVMLLHRNVNTPPGSMVLSNGFVELDRAASLSLGVPPTFAEQVSVSIREQVQLIVEHIANGN